MVKVQGITMILLEMIPPASQTLLRLDLHLKSSSNAKDDSEAQADGHIEMKARALLVDKIKGEKFHNEGSNPAGR